MSDNQQAIQQEVNLVLLPEKPTPECCRKFDMNPMIDRPGKALGRARS